IRSDALRVDRCAHYAAISRSAKKKFAKRGTTSEITATSGQSQTVRTEESADAVAKFVRIPTAGERRIGILTNSATHRLRFAATATPRRFCDSGRALAETPRGRRRALPE